MFINFFKTSWKSDVKYKVEQILKRSLSCLLNLQVVEAIVLGYINVIRTVPTIYFTFFEMSLRLQLQKFCKIDFELISLFAKRTEVYERSSQTSENNVNLFKPNHY